MRGLILVWLCLASSAAYSEPDRGVQSVMDELRRPTILLVIEPAAANGSTPVREPKTVPLPDPEPEDPGSLVPS